MLNKLLLVAGGVALLFYFLVAARNRPVQKLGMSVVFVVIIALSLKPQVSDRIAALVGVDRGVDLALYLATLALLFICFNLYLGQKALEDRLTVVVRQLALISARTPPPPAAAPQRSENTSSAEEK